MKEEIVAYEEHADFDGSDIVISRKELVRCKDCKFTQEPIIEDYVGKRIWCNRLDRYFDNDWFCADGEKR